MPGASAYRERVPVPDWVMPAARAGGALWLTRRVWKTFRRGFGVGALLSLAGGALTALSLVGAVRWLSTVAVEVGAEYVHVAVGPIERRIPVHDVESVDIVTYNPLRFLGWGYRSSPGGREAFSQIGVRQGVEIVATQDGRHRHWFISSKTPAALATAIASAAGLGDPSR